MRRGYFTPPVLIILAIIIFTVAILIALNTDLVKRLKKEPSPSPNQSPTTQQISPSPDKTANWKTYINSELKYSLKHPKEMTETTFKDEGSKINVGFPKDPNCSEFCFKGFFVAGAVVPGEKVLRKELIEQGRPGFSNYSTKDVIFKEIEIDGVKALRSEGGVLSAGFSKIEDDILILKDETLFQIRYSVDTQEQLETINQILSTFRFID